MLAPAKINLYLNITGKLNDGYHLLESLIVPLNICDIVEVSENNNLTLEIYGPFAPLVNDQIQDNIIIKAANKLANVAGINNTGAKIVLHKNIPVGAGLGGGSADAAATLKLLNQLWQLNYPLDKLMQIGLQIGADVPFCLKNQPAIVTSIGEKIQQIPFIPKAAILLVNPNKTLSTAKVYNHNSIKFSAKSQNITIPKDLNSFCTFLEGKNNDLQKNAINMLPEISNILDVICKQNNCRLARMSGSGPTCFGIFEKPQYAQEAAKKIQKQHDKWWVMCSTLG